MDTWIGRWMDGQTKQLPSPGSKKLWTGDRSWDLALVWVYSLLMVSGKALSSGALA